MTAVIRSHRSTEHSRSTTSSHGIQLFSKTAASSFLDITTVSLVQTLQRRSHRLLALSLRQQAPRQLNQALLIIVRRRIQSFVICANFELSGTKYYKSQSGDNCAVIAKKFGTFTVDDFISWNPAVQQDCSKLFLDYYYCVAVPGTPTTPINSPTPTPTQHGPQPQQPGITDRCDNYYKVGNGDNCYNIEQRFGISAAQFNRCKLWVFDFDPTQYADLRHREPKCWQ